MKYALSLIILLLSLIKGIENSQEKDEFKDSLNTYSKLNYFETINQNQSFIIKTSIKSIAYFDSYDKNSIIYISTKYEDFISENDEKITGKFYTIEPNTQYYIRNYLYDSPSVFKKYLYPLDLNQSEIAIDDNKEQISFLYLEKKKSYTLNFINSTIRKMIKLSDKTLNSKIKIIKNGKEETELNQTSRYYKLEEYFKGKLILEVEEGHAFIEFLSNYGAYTIFTEISIDLTELTRNMLVIIAPKTQKNFIFTLYSRREFYYSVSYGISNLRNYYYYSVSNKKIKSEMVNSNFFKGYVELITPFKNINLLENEFLSIAVTVEKSLYEDIYLTYYQDSSMGKLYDEEMSEDNCTKIIDNLKNILEIYVYTDIAKNPPDISGFPNYHHKRIDLKEELGKVSKVNRKFYEFYQEIQKILTSTKDLHFNIYAHETPKGIKFGQYSVGLPFDFEIRKYNGKYRIFINKNDLYNNTKNQNLKNFIDSHLEIPLKKINDIDPFEYIQNWSKYRQTKNPHALFSKAIGQISDFYLCNFPVDYSDLYNEYEFEDNKLIRMMYFNNFGKIKENDVEFNNYFLNIFKSQNVSFQMPKFHTIKDNFLISKGLKKEEKILKIGKIKWDILYEEKKNYLKCRVDEKNKVNVLVQNSFSLEINKGYEKALDCTRLFYSNEYPIIIIEDNNAGGYLYLLILMQQILQVRLVNRNYESFRLSDNSKKYFSNQKWDFVDIETCNIGKSFNDMNEIIDHYNYNNLDIEHKRTKVIDTFSRDYRDALNNFRKEYIDSKYIKKPTDIIIFTDSYSYSATSGFIKGFQSTGGAIIVGYYGNPTKEGIDLFDGSQSHSSVEKLPNTEMSKNLNNLGFTIQGVTVSENYDDFYQEKNPIPREYTLEPVDYRVDIYSRYSDDIYETFINEGLNVHKLFNNGSYCNGKNDKLLLHDDNCQEIEGVKYAHGGYKCNSDNTWNKKKCEPYWCDIGFYYDHYKNTCIAECPFDKNKKVFFIHEKNYNKEFNIEQNMNYTFIFLYNENYYYFFESSEESIYNFPRIFFYESNRVLSIINNKNKTLPIRIKSIDPIPNPNIHLVRYYFKSIEENKLYFVKGKNMYIFQSLSDSCFFINNILKRSNGVIKFAKYNSSMSPENIITINNNYFSDLSENLFILEKNQIYFLYFDFNDYEEIIFHLTPVKTELIKINKLRNILYLEQNKNYTLDFSSNVFQNIMIKLSRKTLNSEIILKDENISLNENYSYYPLKDKFTGKINLEINKENALIEILYKYSDKETDIINLEEQNHIILNKTFNFIVIPKNYTSHTIIFNLNNKTNSNSILAIYKTYTIPPYSLDYELKNNNNGILLNNFTIKITDHYKDEIHLMENESYCIIIQTLSNDLKLNLDVEIKEEKEEEDNKEDKDNKGIKTWQIVLIIIGSIIILILVIILIIAIKGKKKLKSDKVEEKVQKLTEIEI